MNALTVSYPAGWSVRPATEPWTSGWLTMVHPGADVVAAPEGEDSFIALASQPLGGKSAEQWIDDFVALGSGENCAAPRPYTIDDLDAVITDCEDGPHALIVSDGRAHVVWTYSIDDRTYVEQILDTVQLN